jgi:hypothetical protein
MIRFGRIVKIFLKDFLLENFVESLYEPESAYKEREELAWL